MAQNIHHDKHLEKDLKMQDKPDIHMERLNEPGLMQADMKSGMAAAGASDQVLRDDLHRDNLHRDKKIFEGEPIIEKIYEKPIVISHQDKAVFKETYEGKTIEKHELAKDVQTHIAQPIVKEIHQDVIHEHHKDVTIEHKKDILHEHHQEVIHEHHQPVIIEKHVHEHIQPIIHEKHQTLIEEKHVPIVHEQHTHMTDKEEKDVITDEVKEKAIVKEIHEQPIVTETVEKTIIHKEGEEHLHKDSKFQKEKEMMNPALGSGAVGAHGTTHVHETLEKDGQLLEDEEWIVDEKGHRVKQKKGFFGQLKDKITGHSH